MHINFSEMITFLYFAFKQGPYNFLYPAEFSGIIKTFDDNFHFVTII
jgi:hypothetical protein